MYKKYISLLQYSYCVQVWVFNPGSLSLMGNVSLSLNEASWGLRSVSDQACCSLYAKFALFSASFYFCDILSMKRNKFYAIFRIYTQQVLRNFAQNNLRKKQNSAKFAQNAIFCARTISCIMNKILTTKFFYIF